MCLVAKRITEIPKISIVEHFADIKDPRRFSVQHRLINILTIAICAVICGADNWVEVEQFGRAKESWFGSFLSIPYGIPSHDTFGRLFSALDPDQFQRCFLNWTQAVATLTAGEIIPIDGKQLRGSHDQETGKKAISIVSAWASQNNLVLGQTNAVR